MRSHLKEFFSSLKAKRQRQKHEWIFSWSTSLLTKIFKSSSLRQKKSFVNISVASHPMLARSMTWRMGKWEYETRKCKNCLHNRRHLPLIRILAPFFIITVDWRNHAHIFDTFYSSFYSHHILWSLFSWKWFNGRHTRVNGRKLFYFPGKFFPHFTHLWYQRSHIEIAQLDLYQWIRCVYIFLLFGSNIFSLKSHENCYESE